MKLLMISGDRSILAGRRGAFWYMLEEFSKHWESIDIISPCAKLPAASCQLPARNVFFHPSPWPLWRQPWWILEKGSELIAEHHHAVMTVHEYPPFYNGMGAGWLHRATGIPFVLEIHHIVGWPRSASLVESIGCRLSQWILPREARAAAAVRVVNREAKGVLADWGISADTIHVVPSFYLDHTVLQPSPHVREEYDVVFAGRLTPNKGLPALIDAMAKLPGKTLLVIGDGPERRRAERRARAFGITNRVTFAGWLPSQRDVLHALQTARIFVMNSLSEGGPRIALEAMACGMPVIATRVGVMPEVIQDGINGLFTDGTPEDLPEKISLLLSKEALRTHMGAEARKVLQKFERVRLIKEYAEFLRTISSASSESSDSSASSSS